MRGRSETIGKDSAHVTPTITVGTSEAREPRVEAADFTMLKKGGRGIVEALVFQPGRVWKASGKNYMRVRFRQGGA